MNNKAQTLGLSVLYAVFFFVLGILFINFLQPDIRIAQTSLDCSNVSGISDGNKLTCLLVDGVMPYFIIAILSTAVGIITSRLTGG